jgi:hypothetical protein
LSVSASISYYLPADSYFLSNQSITLLKAHKNSNSH